MIAELLFFLWNLSAACFCLLLTDELSHPTKLYYKPRVKLQHDLKPAT